MITRLPLRTPALLLAALLVPLAGCAGLPGDEDAAGEDGLTPVTVMLDWVPNTNHTGLYVARDEGYYREAGLDVEIVEPGEVFAEAALVGGVADFGVSFQEQLTMARARDGAPLVSIAPILQHNSSAFVSRAEDRVRAPADFEGLLYGSYGSPFERPTIERLMACDDPEADPSTVEEVVVGVSDPVTLLREKQIDLAWIFLGWDAVQAELQGVALDAIPMEEHFDCIPDYYTPLLATTEGTIEERPELVRAFLQATSRGYDLAERDPEAAADILLAAAPELDPELVRVSQDWMAPRYRAEAPRWGQQEEAIWRDYAAWMIESGVIEGPFDAAAAFTTDFLPEG